MADDHAHFRSVMGQVLEWQTGLEVVGEAADGHQAVELCRSLRPEWVLMDLSMPGMDGISATRAIKGELPGIHVLVLTVLGGSAVLSRALDAGATGCLSKHAPLAIIIDAVRRALVGDPPLLSRQVFARESEQGQTQGEKGCSLAEARNPRADDNGRGGDFLISARRLERLVGRLGLARGRVIKRVGQFVAVEPRYQYRRDGEEHGD